MHEIVWQFSLISAFLNIKVNLLLFPSSLVLTVYKRAILLSVLSTLSTIYMKKYELFECDARYPQSLL